MSGTVGVREYLQKSGEHERWATSELAAVLARRGELPQALQQVENDLARAANQLARALLPTLDQPALNTAKRLSGWRPTDNPLERREKKRVWLEREITETSQNQLYLTRDSLLDDTVGELPIAERRLAEERAPLDETWTRLQHPRLERLIEAEYGTPRYAVPWWRFAYYEDWKAGDEILEKFPEKHTGEALAFGVLREMYLELREAREALTQEQRKLTARRREVEGIITRHDEAKRGLETLEADQLMITRDELVEYLLELQLSVIGPRIASAPELEVLAKRIDGLRAKSTYLEEMRKDLDRLATELRRTIAQCQRDRVKYSRPKKSGTRWPADKVEHRFRDRSARSQKYWDRYDKGYSRVLEFDDYARVNPSDQFLWWDVMTNGCHAPHVGSVVQFHESHPQYRWTGWDDSDAAAASAGAPDRDHFVDAS